ncbi:MAG TPA: C10 family peptidase [Candidatus Prevotella avicola]|uniref:C10 family peptidase n=1 Tax=Candidatus Prevotella avicola TaxID=2838738 RepID=A0A9D2JV85_9BACT|nr:C10 family peptidase [Candidatus Prevotella avicola]
MRKILLLFSLFLVTLVAWGEPIDRNEALKQANAFLSSKGIPVRQSLDMAYAQPGKADEARSLYYVFNVGNDKGFVIVAGDDAVSPILAYADCGDFSEREMAPAAKAMLENYAQQIEMIQQDPSLSVAAATSYAAIAPMVETQWNQMEPYNYMCPTISGEEEQSVTGCVATAMAQIIYYHKYPVEQTKPIPAYQLSSGDVIPGADPVTLNWDAMQLSYTGSEAVDDPSALAVAQLMVLCGKSVKMSYSSSASSAASESVPAALKEYFDYDGAAHMVYRDEYANADWEKMIYDELAAKRPVYLSGRSVSGTSEVGHAFVCDGYDGEGLFHINWGWGGMSDGFFRLTLLNPSDHGTGGNNGSGGYNLDQGAIIGIQPNQGGTSQEVAQMTLASFASTKETVTRNSSFAGFAVPVNATCWNMTSQTFNVEVGLACYDDSDEMVGEPTTLAVTDIGPGYGFSFEEDPLTMGTRIADGIYYVKFVHKVNGADAWTLMKNANKYYLELRVNGNTATVINHAPQEDFVVNSVDVQGNKSVGSKQTFTYNITNTGDTYTQGVIFFVNNEIISQIGLNLDPGATDDYVFSWTPTREGTFNVGLATADGTEIITSQDVTIGEAKAYNLSLSFKVDNCTGNEIVDYEVTGNVIKGVMQVTNLGEYDYVDDITCLLCYDGNDNYMYLENSSLIPAEVKAGETVDVPFEFANLNYSKRYALVVYYNTEGHLSERIISGYYKLIDNSTAIEGIEASGEEQADQPVYNLQGVRMPDGASLPKGIYIKGGKKIVVK